MIDVGKAANVSAQTVSRYFTGNGYVSDDARTRIAEAIATLGYVPSLAARSLRAARTDSIGVLTIGALNYGSSGVLTGIGRAARDAHVSVSIAPLDLPDDASEGWEDDARLALARFESMRVDGLIVSSPVPGFERILDAWNAKAPAVVVAAEAQPGSGAPRSHSYLAGVEATRHLIALGHARILHVPGPRARIETMEREHGYEDTMREHGFAPVVAPYASDWSPTSGITAAHDFDPTQFSAVFCANDEIALGFLHGMRDRGFQAPRDFSIIGVDDMPAAAHFTPPLTTMRMDFVALGADTFAALRKRIVTGEEHPHPLPQPELVVRVSTAPAAHAGQAGPPIAPTAG